MDVAIPFHSLGAAMSKVSQPAPAADGDDQNCSVSVKGIPFDTTEEAVLEIFDACGTIAYVHRFCACFASHTLD